MSIFSKISNALAGHHVSHPPKVAGGPDKLPNQNLENATHKMDAFFSNLAHKIKSTADDIAGSAKVQKH
jgi:hypothetical protein